MASALGVNHITELALASAHFSSAEIRLLREACRAAGSLEPCVTSIALSKELC